MIRLVIAVALTLIGSGCTGRQVTKAATPPANHFVYKCQICKQKFVRTVVLGGPVLACSVVHTEGTCCHYGEKVVAD